MNSSRNRVAGQASRRQHDTATLETLRRMPGSDERDRWVREWRQAHALVLDGLPRRLAAQVRTVRAAIRVTWNVIRRGVQRGQG